MLQFTLKKTFCAKREKKITCCEEKSQPPPPNIKWSIPYGSFYKRKTHFAGSSWFQTETNTECGLSGLEPAAFRPTSTMTV